jgi:cell division protein ZipA
MSELRWILLAAGLLLLVGIYVFGMRGRRGTRAAEPERAARVEPATSPASGDAARLEPGLRADDAEDDDEGATGGAVSFDELESEPAIARRVPGSVRREPRFEPQLEAAVETRAPAHRPEPRPEARPEGRPESRIEPHIGPRLAGASVRDEPAVESASAVEAAEPSPPPRTGRRAATQKIVAVRVVALQGEEFDGARLLEALQADGFTFGRYQIFHRLDETGRPLVSLASLKEPGTFDPASMHEDRYRGVALFAVMPGPLPGLQAFDELIVTARALSSTLGGQLQDERGGPLTLQRITQLREEAAAFERAQADAGPG